MEFKDFLAQFQNLSLDELKTKEDEITREMAKLNYNPDLVNKLFAVQTLIEEKSNE